MPRALLVYPRFNPNSFWNYQATCELVGARYPAAPLGLITVAALLPASWSVRLVNRNTEELTERDLRDCDIVMTGGMLPQYADTQRVLELAQQAGKPTVVGGPDVTSRPERYVQADFRVLGEAEEILASFVAAWEAGERSGTFRACGFPDVTRSPIPRFDLLKVDQYLNVGVQYSRGCPFNCEFCDIIELYGRVPRTKTNEQMLAELDALYQLGFRGHVDFVDDNLIGNKKNLRAFLPALARWQRRRGFPFEFSTEASINLADDEPLLKMLQASNFFAVFVGIESSDTATLVHTQKHQNTRRDLTDSVFRLYRAGLFVNAGFIVGFDSENGEVAPAMVECIRAAAIPVCMVGLLFALPNTQLSRRLEREGRLFSSTLYEQEHQSDQCTEGLNFETLRPRQAILGDYLRVVEAAYDPSAYFDRVRRMVAALDCSQRSIRPYLTHWWREIRAMLRLCWRLGVRQAGARREFWGSLVSCLGGNPQALRSFMAMAALYLHLGPFSRFVAGRIRDELSR